jgi:hypothetical protein
MNSVGGSVSPEAAGPGRRLGGQIRGCPHWRRYRRWVVFIVLSAILVGPWIARSSILAATTPEDLSKYVVAYDGTHRSIEVVGPLGPGIAEAFRQEFEKHPDVKWVNLTSPGGLVVEGRRLRDLIYARQLNIYVRTGCVSACTLAFIAGQERVMRKGAFIGFHQYRKLGSKLTLDVLREHFQNQDRSYFSGRGVSREFLNKMFDADNSSMWELSAEEAVKAKLATAATDRFDAPPIEFVPADSRKKIGEGFARFGRLYTTLETYEPETYYRFVITIYDVTMSGASLKDAEHMGEAIWLSVLDRLVPTTSDAAAQAMARSYVPVYTELRRIGPKACIEAVLGDPSAGDEWNSLSDATTSGMMEAFAAVIEDAHQKPQPVPSRREHTQAVSEIAQAMARAMSSSDIDFVADTAGYRSDPDRLCRLMADYMTVIAEMPGQRGGALLRALVATE